MSRLQDILEQFKQRGEELLEKIKETEAYQKISDRYESLSPQGQKATKIISAIILVLIVVYTPLSQLSNSKELIGHFESKRQLIRDLFKVYRESGSQSALPQAPTPETVMSMINSTLQSEQLLPEQILTVQKGTSEGRLIPQNMLSEVIDVRLSKLNLRQIVDIGARLAQLSKALKLKDMSIQAHAESKDYYDVTYKVYALNVPAAPPEPPPEPENKNPKKKDKTTTTEDGE